MTTKEALHRLVDQLPDDGEELEAVRAVLIEHLKQPEDDPVPRAIRSAPLDDEPTTPEEEAAAARAWAAYQRGEYVSNDDLRREIGW